MPLEEKLASDEGISKKAASAFRTIGETSEELDVPQHVLRFWEKRFNQLSPVKRRGRRYYRPEDIELLKQIKILLYKEGYTIKGVQKYLVHSDIAQSSSKDQPDLFNKSKLVVPANESSFMLPGQDIKTIHKQLLKSVINKLNIANERLKDALR